MAEPRNVNELRKVIDFCESEGLPFFVLGGGSNVLFPDDGFHGVVIRMKAFSNLEVNDNIITAGAGVLLKRLINISQREGLSGFEPLIGIPGEVGGSIVMNAGLKEREIGDLLESVTIFSYEGDLETLAPSELGLSYRSSKIQNIGIIVEAKFRLIHGDKEKIAKLIEEYLERRKSTQPYGTKSAGCIFKNPAPDLSAGYLLDKAGLKGFRKGDAMYSTVHGNFIINLGNAKASDVTYLIEEGKRRVFEEFGYQLEEEIVRVEDPWESYT